MVENMTRWTDQHHKLVTTRSGIKIGSAYTPPMPRMGTEAEHVQSELLAKHTDHFERCLDFIDRWAVTAYVLMFAFGLGFWLVARWWR